MFNRVKKKFIETKLYVSAFLKVCVAIRVFLYVKNTQALIDNLMTIIRDLWLKLSRAKLNLNRSILLQVFLLLLLLLSFQFLTQARLNLKNLVHKRYSTRVDNFINAKV